jgi:hypothetical protein
VGYKILAPLRGWEKSYVHSHMSAGDGYAIVCSMLLRTSMESRWARSVPALP